MVKNNWLVAGIAVLSATALTIFVVIIMSWCGAVSLEGKTSVGDLLRTLILCIGGIGTAIGLDIAIKRQDKFLKQVQVQIDQGFNDRLGRGVEKLIAELGSAYLCADLQITPAIRPDHAAYIKHWLGMLKADEKVIFRAAAKVSQASEFLRGLQKQADAAA